MVFYSNQYFKLEQIHVIEIWGILVNLSVHSQTASQVAKQQNLKQQLSCTTAFSIQQLSLHSQPATAQTNRPLDRSAGTERMQEYTNWLDS
jgi:hypothetical protein